MSSEKNRLQGTANIQNLAIGKNEQTDPAETASLLQLLV
jgi:hypothetical protein